MLQFRRRVWVLYLALSLAVGLKTVASADTPATEPQALIHLNGMVTNLGYTTRLSDDKQRIYIDWQGQYKYPIGFTISADNTIIYAFIDLNTFKPATLTKVPYVKIFEYDDTHNTYFSMENTDSGEDLFINRYFPVAGLTPQILRAKLEGLAGNADDTDKLWNDDLWK